MLHCILVDNKIILIFGYSLNLLVFSSTQIKRQATGFATQVFFELGDKILSVFSLRNFYAVVFYRQLEDVVYHELLESILIQFGISCRNAIIHIHLIFEKASDSFESVFTYLSHVPDLQVINNSKMIHELCGFSNHIIFFTVHPVCISDFAILYSTVRMVVSTQIARFIIIRLNILTLLFFVKTCNGAEL